MLPTNIQNKKDNHFLKYLKETLNKVTRENKKVILTRDFNLNLKLWLFFRRNNYEVYFDKAKLAKDIEELKLNQKIESIRGQINQKYTFFHENIMKVID